MHFTVQTHFLSSHLGSLCRSGQQGCVLDVMHACIQFTLIPKH